MHTLRQTLARYADLSSSPKKDGITLNVNSFSHIAKDLLSTRLGGFIEQSKVEELLGVNVQDDIRESQPKFLWIILILIAWTSLCSKAAHLLIEFERNNGIITLVITV